MYLSVSFIQMLKALILLTLDEIHTKCLLNLLFADITDFGCLGAFIYETAYRQQKGLNLELFMLEIKLMISNFSDQPSVKY